ncbi:MAG: PA14 domain-containing protein, partial [Armatimonadota bacterium]
MNLRTVLVLLLALAVLASAVPASAAIHKVVFRDEGYALSWMPAEYADMVADYMVSKGFTRVDAAQLRKFMEDRLKDRDPSVVVMANDVVPDTVMEPIDTSPNVECLFNKYLHAGGKVIYLADWPAYYIGLSDGTRPAWNDSGAAAALGFWPARWGYNDIRTPTVFNDEGKKWGFTKPWLSARAANPADVDIVLGNPEGRPDAAMPWVKTYNNIGRPGAGFLFLYDFPWGDAGWRGDFNDDDLEQIARVASYFPAGDKPLTTELSGTVVLPSGPAANQRLAFKDDFGTYYVRTDANGAFKVYAAPGKYAANLYYLGALLPIGTFEVKGDPTQTVSLGVDLTDKTPPSAVADLTVTGTDPNSVKLTWTAPAGDAFLYEIRYTISVITDANWNSLPSIVVVAKGGPGTKESLDVTGLQPMQRYNFGIKAIDANLNASVIATAAGNTQSGVFGDGLKGEYYQWDYNALGGTPDRADVFTPANLVATRYDAPVNFGWGSGAPHPSVRADDFAVRWTGYVVAPTSEDYTFYVVGDDGVVLWLSEKPINPANPGDPITDPDGWRLQGDTEYASQPIALKKGEKYYLMFEMYERGGGATARLRWSSPSISKQAIPGIYLYSGEAEAFGRITGAVLDANGKPLANAVVTISGPRNVVTSTGADGAFTALLPPGDYTVNAALGTDDILKAYNASLTASVKV